MIRGEMYTSVHKIKNYVIALPVRRTVECTVAKLLSVCRVRSKTNVHQWEGKPIEENIGILLLRNIYHYWFHLGKAHAIRQMMGHSDLPVYVGNMSNVKFLLEE